MNQPLPRLTCYRPLEKFSIVIPALNEAGCVESTVRHLNVELSMHRIPHEIVVVDDGSTDDTWGILQSLAESITELKPVRNDGLHGFGRAIRKGFEHATGDALCIMMADESDDCRDVVRYWQELEKGVDCVFGSRFIRGSGLIDYPRLKLIINRLVNFGMKTLFRLPLNDVTNAFKAYRREVIDGAQPILAPHFNLTVELPLKAIVRGYSYSIIPITWRNRKHGVSKLNLREMGSRYFFIMMYVWLEKHFSRGDYVRVQVDQVGKHNAAPPDGQGERVATEPLAITRKAA